MTGAELTEGDCGFLQQSTVRRLAEACLADRGREAAIRILPVEHALSLTKVPVGNQPRNAARPHRPTNPLSVLRLRLDVFRLADHHQGDAVWFQKFFRDSVYVGQADRGNQPVAPLYVIYAEALQLDTNQDRRNTLG